NIARWDGSGWSSLGSGLDNAVLALQVFDDGAGAVLYAGGSFAAAGGVAARSIATWNGVAWSALASGVTGNLPLVFALTVFDDGEDAALYVGGSFTHAGGVRVNGIARWDGAAWSRVGSGVLGIVATLAVFDDGT